MSWPTPAEINEAIQNPQLSFRDPELAAGQPETDQQGIPLARSGSNADVYCFTCADQRVAVKCFTRPIASLERRYQAVHEALGDLNLPFTVDFSYQSQGLWLLEQWFPLVRMKWVDGMRLNEFAKSMISRRDLLQGLIQILAKMGEWLDANKVGHCDLQHGNILLIPSNDGRKLAVRLVDYDGMWVPALANEPPQEFGHPDYQHPQRLTSGYYGPAADRFSLLALATGLRGLIVYGDELWNRYDNSVNVLFQKTDFEDPHRSPLFEELGRSDDEVLRRLSNTLADACAAPIESAPYLSEVLKSAIERAETTPSGYNLAPEPEEVKELEPGNAKEPPLEPLPLKKRKPPKARRRRLPLYIGGGVTVALLTALILVLTLGGKGNPREKGSKTAEGKADETPPKSKVIDGKVYLSDLQEFDWRGLGFAKNGEAGIPGGILVNGKKFPKGIWTHPTSKNYASMKYTIDGLNAQALEGKVAINDTAARGAASPLIFEVRGDDKVLWYSRPVKFAHQIQDCSVKFQRIHVLELRVYCQGFNAAAHAVWLDPYLVTPEK